MPSLHSRLSLEPVVGFEPTTDGLQNRCSTTELNWLDHCHITHWVMPRTRNFLLFTYSLPQITQRHGNKNHGTIRFSPQLRFGPNHEAFPAVRSRVASPAITSATADHPAC